MEEPGDTSPHRGREEQRDEAPALRRDDAGEEREERLDKLPALRRDSAGEDTDQTGGTTRIMFRPHEEAEVVKRYEYGRGQFVTFTAEAIL